MASTAKTIMAARRWIELADEYDQLAVSLERGHRPALYVPIQQPIQQQQSRQKAK